MCCEGSHMSVERVKLCVTSQHEMWCKAGVPVKVDPHRRQQTQLPLECEVLLVVPLLGLEAIVRHRYRGKQQDSQVIWPCVGLNR